MTGSDELRTPSPFETRGQDKVEEVSGRNGGEEGAEGLLSPEGGGKPDQALRVKG